MHIYPADYVVTIIYCDTTVDVTVILANLLCLGDVWEGQSSRVLGIFIAFVQYCVYAGFTFKFSNLISAYQNLIELLNSSLSATRPRDDELKCPYRQRFYFLI